MFTLIYFVYCGCYELVVCYLVGLGVLCFLFVMVVLYCAVDCLFLLIIAGCLVGLNWFAMVVIWVDVGLVFIFVLRDWLLLVCGLWVWLDVCCWILCFKAGSYLL